ncbi:hypothetical protein B0H19DRAFT_1250079 [Mycena capillaripes]|nr:hypothetical protein B0H19DRAFT_1250079 [Mycena capillaripes]
MFRHCARRSLLLRNGFVEKQGVLSSGQNRFKATTPPPPRPQRADLQSILPTIRELLPEPQKRDPNSPPKKRRRNPFFYIALISPFFIWRELEQYFDAQPLLEKKRKRILRERLTRLRDANRADPIQLQHADLKSVVAYLRRLFSTMLPDDTLRTLHFKEVCDLLEEGCPEKFLASLREICLVTYDLSLKTEDEATEVKAAEHIQDTADEILRRGWLAVHRRLPLPVDTTPEPAALKS